MAKFFIPNWKFWVSSDSPMGMWHSLWGFLPCGTKWWGRDMVVCGMLFPLQTSWQCVVRTWQVCSVLAPLGPMVLMVSGRCRTVHSPWTIALEWHLGSPWKQNRLRHLVEIRLREIPATAASFYRFCSLILSHLLHIFCIIHVFRHTLVRPLKCFNHLLSAWYTFGTGLFLLPVIFFFV